MGRLRALVADIERLSEQEDGSDVISGRVLVARAMVERMRGDNVASLPWTARAIECHRRTADITQLLATIALHSLSLTHADDGPRARTAITEALELAAGHPDHRWRQLFDGMLAVAAVAEGRFEEAEERLQEIVRRPERTDFAATTASSFLADCAFGRGDGVVALERYLVALEYTVAIEDVVNSLIQIAGVAASLSLLGRDAEAARLTTATDRTRARRAVRRLRNCARHRRTGSARAAPRTRRAGAPPRGARRPLIRRPPRGGASAVGNRGQPLTTLTHGSAFRTGKFLHRATGSASRGLPLSQEREHIAHADRELREGRAARARALASEADRFSESRSPVLGEPLAMIDQQHSRLD
jgi:hypothetical protein